MHLRNYYLSLKISFVFGLNIQNYKNIINYINLYDNIIVYIKISSILQLVKDVCIHSKCFVLMGYFRIFLYDIPDDCQATDLN